MKEHLLFILIFLLTFIFISCSSRTYFVHSDYRDGTIDNPTVLIPQVDEVRVHQRENIFDNEEISYVEDVFKKELNSEMAEYILPGSRLNRIYHIDYKLEPVLAEKTFKLGDEILLMEIPGQSIDINDEKNVFLLLIANPVISIDREEIDSSDPAKHYSANTTAGNQLVVNTSKPYEIIVSAELQYALFDNENEQVAYYGTSEYEERFREGDNLENIIAKGVRKMSEEIISNSPFSKR